MEMTRYNAATGRREHLPEPERGMPTHDGQTISSASQSSRLGSRESNPIDFPATCAAENLPEAKRDASPRADQGGPKPAAMEREYPFNSQRTSFFDCFIRQTDRGR